MIIKEKNKSELILHILLLLCGWDLSAVDFGGFNFRLAWVPLPLLLFHTQKFKIPYEYFLYVFFFFFLHLLSSIWSGVLIKGAAYSIWILFSYYFFFSIGFYCARNIGNRVFDVFLINGRFQIFCAAVMYFWGLQDRAHFIYYEPSYMAIALIPYVISSFWHSNNKTLDFSFILLFLALSQSGNFVFVLLLASLCKIYSIRRDKYFPIILTSFSVLFSSFFLYLNFDENNINHNLAVSIMNTGVNWDAIWLVIERGGNRIPRMQVAFDVLIQNLLLGTGPSNYTSYIQGIDFSHITNGFEDIEPYGKPPTNIFIEAGLNSGIFGIAILLIFFIYFLVKARKVNGRSVRVQITSIVFIYLAMLQLDSNYLRAYVWVGFGVAYSFIREMRCVKSSTD